MIEYKPLDTSKYKRFFAFGCSMTQYAWPTWADIVAQEIPESYNYGQSGGGNLFISCQITEAHMRHNFTKDDLIMVMWSSPAREDRYLKGSWLTPGNIYTQDYYDDAFVKKFADEFGYLVRDINLITLTKGLLESLNVDFYMMQMSPFTIDRPDQTTRAKLDMLHSWYKDTFESILPDLLNLGVDGRWPSHPIKRAGGQSADYHPSPRQHFTYLQRLFPETQWNENTITFVKDQEQIMKNYRDWDEMTIKQAPNIRL